MLGGWTGTVLRVDLTSGKISKEPLNEQWAREFVGGRGVAARYLYEECDPQVDPLATGADRGVTMLGKTGQPSFYR